MSDSPHWFLLVLFGSLLSAVGVSPDGTVTFTSSDFPKSCMIEGSITLGLTSPKGTLYEFDDHSSGDLTDLTLSLPAHRPIFGIDARDCDRSFRFSNVRKVAFNSLPFTSLSGSFFPETSCNPAFCTVEMADNKLALSLEPVTISGDASATRPILRNLNDLLSLPFDSGTTLQLESASVDFIAGTKDARILFTSPARFTLDGFVLFETASSGGSGIKLDLFVKDGQISCQTTSCQVLLGPQTKLALQRVETPVIASHRKEPFYLCYADKTAAKCVTSQLAYANDALSLLIGTKALGPFSYPNLFGLPPQKTAPVKATSPKATRSR